jgi:hypothetical protein
VEDYKSITTKLLKEFNKDIVWSYSRVNSFKQDPYEWFLHYVKNIPSDKTMGNAYGIYGNMVHDIMEDYYNKKIDKEECLNVFCNKWDELSLFGLKFNSTDDNSELKLKTKYKNDLINFFETFKTFSGECFCEIPIPVVLQDKTRTEVFAGYIDFLNVSEENGVRKYHIIDYKTSTMYKGKSIEEHAQQLLLYAIGLKQKLKCNHEDIDVGWNFLKYVKVEEALKNGKTKERYIERCELIDKLQNSINKWMLEYGYEPIDDCSDVTMDVLPAEVRDKFRLSDCIIKVPFTKESEEMLTQNLLNECEEIRNKVDEYNKTGDDSLFMWEPTERDEFWLYNLCMYSSSLHKPFAEYLHKKELLDEYHNDTPWLDEATDNGENLLDSFFNSMSL